MVENHNRVNPIDRFDLIEVDLCCNDGNNGVFEGRTTAFMFFDCTLTTRLWDDDDGEIGTKIEFYKNTLVVYKNIDSKRFIQVPFFKRYTCPSSWVADTILISRESLANILNFLNKHSKEEWSMEEGITRIFEKWEQNKKFVALDFKDKKEDGIELGILPTIL